MSIIKTLISYILIFSLSASSLFATSLTSAVNVSEVSTNFGTWDSPRTGSRYFYGGSYTFAFKGIGRYQPFFQGEAPKLEKGCNGLSLRGGFVALLGIDEIKFLLKNAGATLAWGLMMGLEYSMPALSSVFNKLRAFAREVQKLLANACNLGKLLTKNTETGKKAQKALDGSIGKMTSQIDDLFSKLNNGLEGTTDILKGWNEDIKDGCAGLTADALAKCRNKGPLQVGDAIERIAANASAFQQSLGTSGVTSSPTTNKLYISNMKDFFDTGKIGDKILIADANQRDEIKTTNLLLRLIFGDYVTPTAEGTGISILGNMLENFPTPPTTGSYSIDGTKLTDFTLAAANGNIEDALSIRGRLPAVIESPEAAAKAILYGIKTSTAEGTCFDGYCEIENSMIYYLDFAKDADGKQRVNAVGALDISNSAPMRLEWDGAYLESLRKIRSLIQTKTGYAPTFKGTGEASVSTSSSISIPLLLPNIDQYLKTIVIIEKKAGRETAYSASLKSILAFNNGYFYAKSLVDMIVGLTMDAMGSKNSSTDIDEMSDYIQQIFEKRDAINKKIKEEMDNQINYTDLIEMFREIEKTLRKENMKGY